LRWKNFNEWKAYATAVLMQLLSKAEKEDNKKLIGDINVLLTRLRYLRGRNLSNFLLDVHTVIRDDGAKELLDIIPTQDEILALIRS